VNSADLSFMTWNKMLPLCLGEAMPDLEKEYPNFFAWNKRVSEREAVVKVLEQSFGKVKE
jgi:glutathione S-transferase